ncbi:MAG: response regulator [Verrucomicrobiota bacterium]
MNCPASHDPISNTSGAPRHRVLIVDDNRAIHEDFRKTLLPGTNDGFAEDEAAFFGTETTPKMDCPFDLTFASQGPEALDLIVQALAENQPFSLIFMDVRMPPGWDGIETTARIWEVDPDVQVVICTAYSDYSWDEMTSKLGRSDRLLILKKPFDTIEVIQLAHSLTAKWSLLQGVRHQQQSLELAVQARTSELELAKTALELEIVERQKILGELSLARDSAIESVRLKSQFLANMSHEIRTPMNGIIGMADLMLHAPLTLEQRDYMETIRSSADLLLGIINDILDSSKIESGKLTFEHFNFNLREMVEGTMDVVANTAQKKGLELAGCVHIEVPEIVRGDPGRLRQVLTNIAGNAVKFTEHGEVSLVVSAISETPTHTLVRFEITDTGIGIDENARAHIFEPFIQVDGSNTRKYGGTGLGLTISRQIVEALGGQIGVDSKLGEGSVFWFNMNFEKSSQPDSSPTSPALPSGMRVLIVDDNATNRTILQYQLHNLGLRSENVASGIEAIESLRREVKANDPFQFALLDMQMPSMDGLTLAGLIKSEEAISATRLVILSSLGTHLDPETFTAKGIEGFVVKPIKQSRLKEVLNSLQSPQPRLQPRVVSPIMTPANSSLRVLLAEDNHVNQKVAILQLKMLGYTADVANDGGEVLKALEKVAYDVILMDCQMPVLDGYATTKWIRENYSRPVWIIAMTANAMEGDREKCLAAGMDDYLSKPIHPEILGDMLSKCPIQASAPPVDLIRLYKITGNDSQMLIELCRDYLIQAQEILTELGTAIEQNHQQNIRLLSHKLGGSSSTCGMDAIVSPLSKIEHIAADAAPGTVHVLYKNCIAQLSAIHGFLEHHLDGKLNLPNPYETYSDH